jgi:hypothetical protein
LTAWLRSWQEVGKTGSQTPSLVRLDAPTRWAQVADAALAARAHYSRNNLPAPGTVVRLRGLEAKPELNGVIGTVTPRLLPPTIGRVLVQLEQEDTQPLSIKPQNIERVDGEPGPNIRTCVSSALLVCHNLALGAGRNVDSVVAARQGIAMSIGPVAALLADDRRTLFGSHLLWRDAFCAVGMLALSKVLISGDVVLHGQEVPDTVKRFLVAKHSVVVNRAVLGALHYRLPPRADANSVHINDPAQSVFASALNSLTELVETKTHDIGGSKGAARDSAVGALGDTLYPGTGTPFVEALPRLVVSWCADPFVRERNRASGTTWESLSYAYLMLYQGTGCDERMVTREAAEGFASALKAEIEGERGVCAHIFDFCSLSLSLSCAPRKNLNRPRALDDA